MLTSLLDYLRIALYGALIVVVLFLYQIWNKEHPSVQSEKNMIETSAVKNGYIPDIQEIKNPATKKIIASASQHLIHIKTDVFQMDIDTAGGNIVQVKLLHYPKELHSTQPVLLMNDFSNTRYLAQSGLLSAIGPDTAHGQAVYTTEQDNYSLDSNQKELQVKLHWQSPHGIKVSKIFTFHPNEYEVGVSYQIENTSNQPWNGNLYLELLRKNTPPEDKQGFVNFATYFGAAISSPEKAFQKITFKQIGESNLNKVITGGWAAMIQHYFVSAWVPEKNSASQYFSRVTNDGLYTIGMMGPTLTALPGATVNTQAKFYAGPSIADQLEKVSPGLQLTIDYGWFWFISAIIFWMMQHIYNFLGNWGWSIVIVTLIIKLMFYHLSAKSYRSMSALKNLQPKINLLKERYGDDKQKFTQATLELYKKEKANPMSGCLPILVQIPVFIGLYWVLIESVQLRQAPFILWIHDLSLKDPYFILPVLMGLSMFLQQRLNPPPPDPMQAKIMMLMPVVFTVMFANFPSGLMLYWFVNNTLSFLQQWLIMHRLEKAERSKKV